MQKLLSLTGINELKIIIFVLYYFTVSVYTKTTIHLHVSGQWGIVVYYWWHFYDVDVMDHQCLRIILQKEFMEKL